MGKYKDANENTCMDFDDFEEFLDAIKPSGVLGNYPGWVLFRGQADDGELIPKLYRNDVHNYFTYVLRKIPDKNDYFFTMEYKILRNYYIKSNSLGLNIPKVLLFDNDYLNDDALSSMQYMGTVKKVYGHLENIKSNEYVDLYELPGIPELAALSQHYGLPTRLLDWTRDVYVALYFAAMGAARELYSNEDYTFKKKMVIWTMTPWRFSAGPCPSINPDGLPPIKFVVSNYEQNPNICAQKGVLSYWKEHYDKEETDYKYSQDSLDKRINDYNQNIDKKMRIKKGEYMSKILLPSSECFKIIQYIDKLGYNASTIFPWRDGISKYYEDMYIIALLNDKHILYSYPKSPQNWEQFENEQTLLHIYRESTNQQKGDILGYAKSVNVQDDNDDTETDTGLVSGNLA